MQEEEEEEEKQWKNSFNPWGSKFQLLHIMDDSEKALDL